MVSREDVLRALEEARGQATTSWIYDHLARKQKKESLTSREKHNVRSALFSLKESGRIKQISQSTYQRA